MTRYLMRLPISEEIELIDFDLAMDWGDFHNSLMDALEPTAKPDDPPRHLRAKLRSLFAQRTISAGSKLYADELYAFLATLTGWQAAFVRVTRKERKKQ
jgi:hypothetical protein